MEDQFAPIDIFSGPKPKDGVASDAPADMLGEAISALVAESQRNPVTE